MQPQHAEVAFDPKGVRWIRDLTNQGQLWVNGQQLAKSALAIGARPPQPLARVRRSTSSTAPNTSTAPRAS